MPEDQEIYDRVVMLARQGMPPMQIAREIGRHFTTVYKYLRKAQQSQRLTR